MNKEKIFKALVHKFGVENQLIVAIEELSELQKELCKSLRKEENKANICEEIADVEIMLEQIKLLFDIADVVEMEKTQKIKRTAERYLNFKSIAYKKKKDNFEDCLGISLDDYDMYI